jgi:hypothetical protein
MHAELLLDTSYETILQYTQMVLQYQRSFARIEQN